MLKRLYLKSLYMQLSKYLASIMNDSTIICDEVIMFYDQEIKTIPTNFNVKKVTCKMQIFYIYLHFY